jgi:signal transduction histidine kinase
MGATGMRAQPLNGESPAVAHRDIGAVRGSATHVSRRFAAVAPWVGEARHFLLSLLPDGSGGSADAMALMLSELATNAVQHASTDFEVAVDIAPDGRHVRVAVSDSAEGFPVPQDTDTESSDGRGLHIVRELADAWGIDVRRGWWSDGAPSSTSASGSSRCRCAPRPAASRTWWPTSSLRR